VRIAKLGESFSRLLWTASVYLFCSCAYISM